MKRIIVSILIMTMAYTVQGFLCYRSYAGQSPAAESKGPLLGKWAFEGNDDKGVVWKGTLTIKELDTVLFDAHRFHSMFILEAESGDSSKRVDAPCIWDPVKREVSFDSGIAAAYNAILSANGESMTQGKWSEADKDFRTRKVIVTGTGVWSATYTGP